MKTALVALVILLAACSDSIAPRSVVGMWELQSFAGEALPSGPLVAEVFTIRDAEFDRDRTLETTAGITIKRVSGTWIRDGEAVVFLLSGSRHLGIFEDGKLTVEWGPGAVSVYARQ